MVLIYQNMKSYSMNYSRLLKLDQAKIKEITANINNMLDKVELHKGDQKIAVENMEKLTEAMLWAVYRDWETDRKSVV